METDLLKKIVDLECEASEFGFQWETAEQIMQQIRSECIEIEEHLEKDVNQNQLALQEEIGDLLHAAFSLCVFCNFDPLKTLAQTADKFERRLKAVKAISLEKQLTNLKDHSFAELMLIWDEAKNRVG